MGSEGRRGPSRLRKRGEGVTRGEHGVRDPVPDGPMPTPGARGRRFSLCGGSGDAVYYLLFAAVCYTAGEARRF